MTCRAASSPGGSSMPYFVQNRISVIRLILLVKGPGAAIDILCRKTNEETLHFFFVDISYVILCYVDTKCALYHVYVRATYSVLERQ